MWLVKLNSTGGVQWNKLYGGLNYEGLFGLQIATDGGYVLAGLSQSSNTGDVVGNNKGGYDALVLKVDNIGNIVWKKYLGGADDEFIENLYQNPDGSLMLVGYSTSSASGEITSTNHGDYDLWITKFSSTGNIVWSKLYGGNGNDRAFSIIKNSDGNYIISGITESSANGDVKDINKGSTDLWLLTIDDNGNIVTESAPPISAKYSPLFKNAIKLNGSTDFVNLSTLGKENLGNEVTFEAWINTDDVAKQMAVVTRGSNDNVNGMGFGIENGKIWASGSNTGIWDVAYAGNITAFKWIHIAATYNKTLGQIKIYQNGELVSTSNRTFVIDGSGFNMNIGRNHTTAIQYFSRKIDDVRVWNTIRTQAEIQNNMNKELLGSETGLVAYYKMNEVGKGNGITVNNSATTGSKFNGITVGGTETPIFISCIGDLSLSSKSLNQIVRKDSTGQISFTLKNQSSNAATNVKVLLKIPYSPPFVMKNSQNCTKGTFDSNMWAIPELAAGDSCVLNVIYQPTQNGVWYVEAEVFSADQEDTDSTPKNEIDTEDDFTRACLTMPISVTTEPFGMQLMLEDPKIIVAQWYKNGTAIAGENKNTLQITALGKYNYSSNTYKCPNQGCCPFIIEKATATPSCCSLLEYILERKN